MDLRPARLLPPKRLSTPRSAHNLSTVDRGLLPGSPALTRAGLAPAGMVQFPGRNIAPSVHETCIRRVRSDRGPAVPNISSAGSPGCGQNAGSRAVRRWQCVGRPRLMQASRGARILFRRCSSRLDHEERPLLVEVGDLRAGGLRAVPTAALLARSHLPRPERERRADDHGEDHDERVQLPVLCEVLEAHTRTSDDCYLCLWEGIGDLHPAVSASPSIVATASGERGRDRRPPSPPPVLDAPKVVVHDRKYLLSQGRLQVPGTGVLPTCGRATPGVLAGRLRLARRSCLVRRPRHRPTLGRDRDGRGRRRSVRYRATAGWSQCRPK